MKQGNNVYFICKHCGQKSHSKHCGTLQGIKYDIKIKTIASVCLMLILVAICFIHRDNNANLLAGFSFFGLLLFIFLLGLKSDYKALKWYKRHLENVGKDLK
ncbi:hypothetical protein [Campylobacter troglodytis]|uniref:hypothetical protein n=1 Tax=Campylobacter troglodytis TaxID=654363 RepID=UPI001156F5C2|nr:hypothetical protein [Campylobacter troglodytis]TQR49847.1 hypothetical protein DMC01_12875 [Campylobacter troglodytis]